MCFLPGSIRPSAWRRLAAAEALGRWQAERDPPGADLEAGDDRAGLRGGPVAAPRKVLDPTDPSVAGAENNA
ncbi:hypothetical protein GCM10009780_68790 [Actinomadura alba]